VGGVVARAARWVVAHRGRVAIGWVAALVLAMAVSHAAKPHFINNLSLPGTESQRATELLSSSCSPAWLSLASAVFLDAFVVRSLLLPSVLTLLGSRTWSRPHAFERRLPRIAIIDEAA
jgi:uncharacterized membrane protein YdfJ with MMPL/SSD domain